MLYAIALREVRDYLVNVLNTVVLMPLMWSLLVLHALLASALRIVWIATKQWRATRGLSRRQRRLLYVMWRFSKKCHAGTYKRPMMRMFDKINERCRLANVEGWRQEAFFVTSYSDLWGLTLEPLEPQF